VPRATQRSCLGALEAGARVKPCGSDCSKGLRVMRARWNASWRSRLPSNLHHV